MQLFAGNTVEIMRFLEKVNSQISFQTYLQIK